MDKNQYLIIGGSTKCGTTSVFKYFEFHPEVCPCVLKESRFFLESEYLFRKTRKQRDFKNVQHFGDLFPDCKPESLRLEATPDYLYSEKAALRIKSELAEVKFIFILRNPVERLKSWYKFAITMGLMDAGISFEHYIREQEQDSAAAHQHMKSLEQGRYAPYIERYFELFGKDRIHVCFYEDLVKDPNNFCSEIAQFAGIDPSYFKNYDFKIYNKTVQVKSVGVHNIFRKFKRTIRPLTRMLPVASRKRLKLAGYNLEQAYFTANKKEIDEKITVSPEMNNFITAYYATDSIHLVQLTGKKLPW